MDELSKNLSNYFGQLTDEELQLIGSFFKDETISKGEYFLKTGQYCQKMSFVEEGLLRVFVHTASKEVTQWIATSKYFITDLNSFVFQQDARWNIQALSDVKLKTISYSDYKQLENRLPQWSKIEKYFISHCFTMLEDRIFAHLALSSEESHALKQRAESLV